MHIWLKPDVHHLGWTMRKYESSPRDLRSPMLSIRDSFSPVYSHTIFMAIFASMNYITSDMILFVAVIVDIFSTMPVFTTVFFVGSNNNLQKSMRLIFVLFFIVRDILDNIIIYLEYLNQHLLLLYRMTTLTFLW